MNHLPLFAGFSLIAYTLLTCASVHAAPTESATLFARSNLVAWCIVPFDSKKRTPEQRVQMLQQLGLHRFAYDWRDEHLPSFDTELTLLRKYNIELTAVWFPATLNRDALLILDILKKHQLTPQLWVTTQVDAKAGQAAALDLAVATVRPVAQAAAQAGCTVALYNHGGWFGEPENQIAIIEKLKSEGIRNLGMVYNLHHGHDHIDRFASILNSTKPYLLALNLNGMTREGDKRGKKILPLGQGDLDLQLLRMIRDSGYFGPIGILNHTDEDAEGRLQDNLEGLDWLVKQLNGAPAGPPPHPRTYHPG